MHFFNINCLLLAVAAAQVADAHTRFTNFFVDDVNQGDGTCVRMSNINDKATNPVKGITGNDMACGKNYRFPSLVLFPFVQSVVHFNPTHFTVTRFDCSH